MGEFMKVVKKEDKLCLCCMENHEVLTVKVDENIIFKGEKVKFVAIYEYCESADEFYATEEMMSENYVAMKNAYKKSI